MKKMDKIDIDRVEEISKIRLSSEEKEEFLSELDVLISHINKISELDCDDIEPVFCVRENVSYAELREDVAIKDERRHISSIEIIRMI